MNTADAFSSVFFATKTSLRKEGEGEGEREKERK